MANNSKYSDWTSALNAVKTPLGFFAMVALIIDGALLVTAALTDKVSMLAPVGLLGFLIVCVFAIVWKKPYALYHPKDWPQRTLRVNLLFPIEDIDIDLDVEHCFLEVRNKEGVVKRRITPNLTFGHGGWTVQLSEDVETYDSVRMEFIENNGQKWKVNPFALYETEQKVIQIIPNAG